MFLGSLCSNFGGVNDVRIPCQQKRMFGFVTFNNADTVKVILSKGNPHYVCGARVLVKPYREKPKHVERYTFISVTCGNSVSWSSGHPNCINVQFDATCTIYSSY